MNFFDWVVGVSIIALAFCVAVLVRWLIELKEDVRHLRYQLSDERRARWAQAAQRNSQD